MRLVFWKAVPKKLPLAALLTEVKDNTWSFQDRGFLVEAASWCNTLVKLPRQGFYVVREEITTASGGRMVFTAACAICHKYGDIGVRDVGPPLAGIGAKSTLELLKTQTRCQQLPANSTELVRCRADEAALRRELARAP